MSQACGAIFARFGACCSSILRPWGLDGTQWQKERRDYSPTGPISLVMNMKDEVRTDDDWFAKNYWQTAKAQLWRLRQPGPPIEFPGEHGILTDIYAQVREEEQVISVQFLGSQRDASTSRAKKRKQVDDATAVI